MSLALISYERFDYKQREKSGLGLGRATNQKNIMLTSLWCMQCAPEGFFYDREIVLMIIILDNDGGL